ncbi:hypothetical protein FMO003_06780 [Moritella sp. F3]|nr:hypothetical protein FMO001_39650 [Moritella sp. F1]GIC80397.1 hypothetical protein FMO003_06780 [Moritella sp. F3]
MNESSKESLDKAKEEVIEAIEKVKEIAESPHVDDDKSRRIKSLIAETEKHL